ncbi:WG repeat-containing protein [Taibaiella soli]|nr:WG repeat-containing protein [Taibaiella soli]
MQHLFWALTFLLITIQSSAQTKKLFKIVEHGKLGFIDQTGRTVIPPKYKNGDDFSENLASVRINGNYGFIDTNGNFAIPPQYDFATDFKNGIARVYSEGQPIFIDKNNKRILPPVYKSIVFISPEKAIVQTSTGNKGIINLKTGQLIADTIYSRLGPFTNGISVVEKVDKKDEDRAPGYAVIDTNGKLIVPFDKYRDIRNFTNGYARVEIKHETDDDSENGFIDARGNFIFQCTRKNKSYVSGSFYDGLAVISLYKYWIPEEKGVYMSSDKSYQGYINLKGDVVLNDVSNRYVYDFSNARAFVEDDSRNFRLIDTKFNTIGKDTFDGVQNKGFRNGYAIVEKENGWGIIDTNGNFVVAPQFQRIAECGITDSCFFYAVRKKDDDFMYGIANMAGKIITQPIITEFDHSGFQNGLLLTTVNNRLTYFDKEGNIIWQEKKYPRNTLDTLDIDFMNRGYFYAHSENYKTDIGGFGGSGNNPHTVSTEDLPDGLSITVDTKKTDTFQHLYAGFHVILANRTKKKILFSAQDSRLYMRVQAKDKDGIWKDIEYLPSSWCGNSYHTLTLAPDKYWEFRTPVYSGEYKTKMRIALNFKNPRSTLLSPRKQQKAIYSNEYDGSINPGQFSNKRAYYPGGLMDPYND